MFCLLTDIYFSMNDKVRRRKKLFPSLLIIVISIILIINGSIFPSAKAQTENCYNLESKNALPVLLIHGWNEGSGGNFPIHFDEWEQQMNQDRIPFCIISFEQSSDVCDSAVDHAKELAQIIQNIISETGQNQVNIVGFSKGGLDARVYLSNDLDNDDVANLIMIGTPNAGSYQAWFTNECSPGIKDLRPGASAQTAEQNKNTKYYTIAGMCESLGDSIVYESSVNSQPYFQSLGSSDACHLDLLGAYEYQLAYDVLVGGQ